MQHILLLVSAAFLVSCQAGATPLPRPAVLSAQNLQTLAVTSISVKEAHEWLADPNASWKLLDLRTPEEFAQGYLKSAQMLNFYASDFREHLLNMDRNQPYIIYCRSGNRSSQALKMMRELGFRNVYEVQGGILAWQSAGYPVVK